MVTGRDEPHCCGCIFLAAVLGTMNVVGGYVVTDRMLEMFKSDITQKTNF